MIIRASGSLIHRSFYKYVKSYFMQVLQTLASKYKQALTSKKALRLLVFAYATFFALWTMCEFGSLIKSCAQKDLSIVHFKDSTGVSDFIDFYVAGQIASSPNRAASFTWQGQRPFFDKLIAQKPGFELHTQHTPLVFLLLTPFARLPIDQSHLLWEFLTTLLAALGIFVLAREFDYLKKPILPIIVLGIFASESAWQNWSQGQIMWLYLGFSCLYLASVFRNRHYVLGGISLAMLIIKPQYMLLLLTPALAMRRYSLLAVTFVTEITFAIISLKVFSLKSLIDYPDLVHQCELTCPRVYTESMNCLRAVLYIFFSQDLAYRIAWILFVIAACISGLFALYLLAKYKERKDIFTWTISSLVLVSLLFSPHAHKQDLLLLSIPAILLLPALSEIQNSSSLSTLRNIFFVMPLISWLLFFLSRPFLPIEVGNQIWILLFIILLTCTIIQVFRCLRETSPNPISR